MASSSRHESDSRDQNLTDNGAKTDPQDVITKIDGDDEDELSKTGIDRDRRRRSNTSDITSMDNKNRGDSRSTSLNRVSGDAQAGSLETGSPGPGSGEPGSDPEGQKQPKRKGASRSSTYAHTKTVAQGFLNISLLSANAGQLRDVIIEGPSSRFYYMLLVMIIASMILQIITGVLLALKYFVDLEDEEEKESNKKTCEKYNNIATVIVLFISALNVLISVFSGY